MFVYIFLGKKELIPICPRNSILAERQNTISYEDNIFGNKNDSVQRLSQLNIDIEKLPFNHRRITFEYEIYRKLIFESEIIGLRFRPVLCPYAGCKKRVSVNSLDVHFKFEHQDVGCVDTASDETNVFKLNLGAILSNKTVCVGLLHLSNEPISLRE